MRRVLSVLLALALALAPVRAQFPLNPYAPTYQVQTTLSVPTTAGAAEFACIEGANSGAMRVLRIVVDGTANTAQSYYFYVAARTTLSTGGSSTTATWGQRDTKDVATSLVMRTWTSPPTVLGTGVVIDSRVVLFQTVSATVSPSPTVFDFTATGKLMTLNGPTEALCIGTEVAITGSVVKLHITVVAQQG